MTIPVKANFTLGIATSLAEFQPGDVLPIEHGGTGATTAEDAAAALGISAGDFATAAQGALADTAQQPNVTAAFAETVIAANSSATALRVTQAGGGNALVIEDEANPDSTPIVVDASGRLLIGAQSATATGVATATLQMHSTASYTPQFALINHSDTGAPYIFFHKRRATGDIVSSTDGIGTIIWSAYDGGTYRSVASIQGNVDGTPGDNDIPTRLAFYTSADGAAAGSERMRINNAGDVSIGYAASGAARLHVIKTTEQLRLGYNTTKYAAFTVDADGFMAIASGLAETPVVANTGTAYTVGARSLYDLTMTGTPVVFTFPTPASGRQFTLMLTQDGTGTRLATWPASVRWAGGTAPTLTTTAGRTDLVSFIAKGTYWLGVVGGLNWDLS